MRAALKQLLFRKPAPWLHNGSWTIGANGLVNNPTLGSELLLNGDFETWSSATNAGTWTESIAGASTVNREGSVLHGGSFACRLDIDGSNNSALVFQAITNVIGAWYQMSVWAKADSATPAMAMNGGGSDVVKTLSSTWAQYFITQRATLTSPTIILKRSSAASRSLYFDDASFKPLTLNQLLILQQGNANPNAVAGAGTIVAHTHCGVAYGFDSYTTPTNGLLAIHDGGTGIQFLKLVGGVWTSLIATTATYVAGLLPKINFLGSNVYQLEYNSVQRGTNQTVTDAGTGIYHGGFSAYSGNVITGVTVN